MSKRGVPIAGVPSFADLSNGEAPTSIGVGKANGAELTLGLDTATLFSVRVPVNVNSSPYLVV